MSEVSHCRCTICNVNSLYEVLISQLTFRPFFIVGVKYPLFYLRAGVTDGMYYFCWAVYCHVFGSLWWSWFGSPAAQYV